MNAFNYNGYFYFKFQVVVSFVILETLFWNAVSHVKATLFERVIPDLHPWVSYFYHPVTSHFLNYLVVCIIMMICGSMVYFLINDRLIERIKAATCLNKSNVIIILMLSGIVLPLPLLLPTMQVIFIYSIVILLPLTYLHAS